MNLSRIRKPLEIIYVLLIVVMAAATVIENVKGTLFVRQNVYGSWWFMALWALLAALAIAYILKRHVHRWNILLLHAAMVVMLLGALLTHLTAYQGIVHLRGDQPSNEVEQMTSMTETTRRTLPFYVRLDRFEKFNHAGTDAAADYVTRFVIMDGPCSVHAQVSMNKIYHYRGIRFYQASYDTDNQGSYLSVNSDPWGIPVTYTGYVLFFVALLWLLVDPKGTFRGLCRELAASDSFGNALGIILLLSLSLPAKTQTTIPEKTADRFGHLLINYNERICPVQTFALDFTQKLYGRRSYEGRSAEQVLFSWIFYPQEWNNEPFIRVKNKEMRRQFGLPDYASVNAFFRNGSYILGPALVEYGQGNNDTFHKACADIDGKLALVMQLRQGDPLSLFPYTFHDGTTQWFSPFEKYPKRLPRREILFFRNVFPLIYGQLLQGNNGTVDEILMKIGEYQQKEGGKSLPSRLAYRAEIIYNACPLATVLFVVNLTLGILGIILVFWSRFSFLPLKILLGLSFAALTFLLVLRWIITGNIPMGNGYETMLSVAWMTQLATLIYIICTRKGSGLMTAFAFLLSGFFLLVSHLSMMDPAMGPLVPVLNSPLLSIHVSFMMMSYALLALTFLCGVMGLLSKRRAGPLQLLSRIFLYPAIVTLGIGIFLGAVWANVSWGNYWSWDPKETWALITFMIYAVALHTQSLPWLKLPHHYHLLMIFAFLSIVMTYFGVNYFLSGMHSYA